MRLQEDGATLLETYEKAVSTCSFAMPDGLDEWIRKHRLEAVFAENLYTTVTWVRNCMFSGASDEQRALTCMDLGLWFYYLDDYDADDDQQILDSCIALIDGRDQPVVDRFPLLAYRDLISRVRSLVGYDEQYLATRRDLVSWYHWRNQINRSNAEVSSLAYHQCRLSTIYIQQWLSLMCSFRDCAGLQARGEVRDLVTILLDWHILINELASMEKDRTRGENNLVLIRAREKGHSLPVAVGAALEELETLVSAYRSAYSRLVVGASDELQGFLQIVDCSIVGALQTYHENARRYQSSFFGSLALPMSVW